MDAKFLIQQGERAKYIVESNRADFDFEENDYFLEICFGMMGQKLTIPKSELIESADDGFIMSFDTSDMVGRIQARMVLNVPDIDIPDSERKEVDRQFIAFVVTTPCPRFMMCPACDGEGHDVKYERTEESDIASKYLRLCDCDGHPLATDDDLYLYVRADAIEEVQQALDDLINGNNNE
jgi:hypothetical protein